MKPNFLTIDPEEDINVLKGLASPIRIRITFWSTHARHHPPLPGTRSRLFELFRAVL